MNSKLYYNHQQKICYYFGAADCKKCKKPISDNLIFHIEWGKNHHIQETYCFNCSNKINNNQHVTENYNCVVTRDLPDSCVPVFIFPPSLQTRSNCSVFNVNQIFKNSEAEEIDRTRLAGRSDIIGELQYKQNKKLLDQRNKELGYSAFIQSERKKIVDKMYNKRINKGEIKAALQLKQEWVEEVNRTIDVDNFFNTIKNSQQVIEHEEKKLLEQKERGSPAPLQKEK